MHVIHTYKYGTLQERCAGADTLLLVAQILHKSKAHLQSMLLQNNAAVVDDFYVHMVCLLSIIGLMFTYLARCTDAILSKLMWSSLVI